MVPDIPELTNKSTDDLRALWEEQVRRMNMVRPTMKFSAESARHYSDAALLKNVIGGIIHTRGHSIFRHVKPRSGGKPLEMAVNGIAPDSFGELRLSQSQRTFLIKAAAKKGVDPMTFLRSEIDRMMVSDG